MTAERDFKWIDDELQVNIEPAVLTGQVVGNAADYQITVITDGARTLAPGIH